MAGEAADRQAAASAGGEISESAAQLRPDLLRHAHEHLRAQRLDAAEEACREVLARGPENTEAAYLLGVIAYRKGDMASALRWTERAAQGAEENAFVQGNLCELYRRSGDLDKATGAGLRAVALKPDFIAGFNNLALALLDKGQAGEALSALTRSLALQPAQIEALRLVGRVCRATGDYAPAIAFGERALAMQPQSIPLLNLQSIACIEKGDIDAAEECLTRLLAADPDNAPAHTRRAMLRMLRNDNPSDLAEFEWRHEMPKPRAIRWPGRRWRGEPVEGRRILVYNENGLGDALHFMRYFPLLAARRPAAIIARMPPRLHDLIAGNYPPVELVRDGGVPEAADLHCEIMSLPLLLNEPLRPKTPQGPYLSIAPDLALRWRARLSVFDGLRVGLAWAGNPAHMDDHNRSIRSEDLLPLFDVEGCRFFSLQIGPGAASPALAGRGLVDLGPEVGDMVSTAAAITALDLVIAIDTSIAHLAGGLGTPVWTMLASVPDWRWGIRGETTQIYRSMRLFRQPARRDWTSVVRHVRAALAELTYASGTNMRRTGGSSPFK